MIGKIYKRLTKKELAYCEQVLNETETLDDDKFILNVNRLGISHHEEFRNFKHHVEMWSLLTMAIEPKTYRRKNEQE